MNSSGDRAARSFGRSRVRRALVWVLLFVVGILPILATASRHAQLGHQIIGWFFRDREDIMTAWTWPRAGEDVLTLSTNGTAAELLKAYGIDRYAVTQLFQDNPGLYQGTVTAAWPAQPSWQGSFRLRLATEDAAPCRQMGRTEQVALDDCR